MSEAETFRSELLARAQYEFGSRSLQTILDIRCVVRTTEIQLPEGETVVTEGFVVAVVQNLSGERCIALMRSATDAEGEVEVLYIYEEEAEAVTKAALFCWGRQ